MKKTGKFLGTFLIAGYVLLSSCTEDLLNMTSPNNPGNNTKTPYLTLVVDSDNDFFDYKNDTIKGNKGESRWWGLHDFYNVQKNNPDSALIIKTLGYNLPDSLRCSSFRIGIAKMEDFNNLVNLEPHKDWYDYKDKESFFDGFLPNNGWDDALNWFYVVYGECYLHMQQDNFPSSKNSFHISKIEQIPSENKIWIEGTFTASLTNPYSNNSEVLNIQKGEFGDYIYYEQPESTYDVYKPAFSVFKTDTHKYFLSFCTRGSTDYLTNPDTVMLVQKPVKIENSYNGSYNAFFNGDGDTLKYNFPPIRYSRGTYYERRGDRDIAILNDSIEVGDKWTARSASEKYNSNSISFEVISKGTHHIASKIYDDVYLVKEIEKSWRENSDEMISYHYYSKTHGIVKRDIDTYVSNYYCNAVFEKLMCK